MIVVCSAFSSNSLVAVLCYWNFTGILLEFYWNFTGLSLALFCDIVAGVLIYLTASVYPRYAVVEPVPGIISLLPLDYDICLHLYT